MIPFVAASVKARGGLLLLIRLTVAQSRAIRKTSWQGQMSSAGSVGHSWFGKLFRSREHWKLRPDLDHTVVTAGYGSGSSLSSTSRTSDGKSVIAYIPNGNATALTVDMTNITDGKGTKVWWFNPATGDVSSGGNCSNRGLRCFTAPDSNDWVLIIDAASAKLPLPTR
ncbi:MAG: hypothetical protein DMG93_12930 [Acidobacteria bacterium]|nr:MAG: hypothetical protein DMG93_12930 [Acidobacteriota bacterium]